MRLKLRKVEDLEEKVAEQMKEAEEQKRRYEKLEKIVERKGGKGDSRYPTISNPGHQHQMEFNRNIRDV